MSRKPKFRPRITRIKLNPEQAVLVCNCALTGMADTARLEGDVYYNDAPLINICDYPLFRNSMPKTLCTTDTFNFAVYGARPVPNLASS